MKLKSKQPTLTNIGILYGIMRPFLVRDMPYPKIAHALYKQDRTKFQIAFKIIFGRECPVIEEEYVSRILLQSGLEVTKLVEYHQLMRSKQ